MDSLITDDEKHYLNELEDRGEGDRAQFEKSELIKRRLHMKNVLASESGRSVIWGIMSSCDIFGTSMTGNSQTYFKEGKRALGLELLNEIIATDPSAWIDLQKENLSDIQKALNESER